MFTFDCKFYKRNAVLDEHPWYLVPSKWMERAHADTTTPYIPLDDGAVSPRILHSCMHSEYSNVGSYGEFMPEEINHDFRCKRCQMRPSDKMITLYTLLK